MKRTIFYMLLSIKILTSCSDETIEPMGPSEITIQTQSEIKEFLLGLGYTEDPTKATGNPPPTEKAMDGIKKILLKKGFNIGNSENEIIIGDSAPNGRTMGCSQLGVFHIDGNGITGSGTSVVVWECSGSYGHFISNQWWVNGSSIGENKFYY